MGENPSVEKARQALHTLSRTFETLEANNSRLSGRETELMGEVEKLTRRALEAEQRAVLFEQRCDALQPKAERNDRIEEACGKLLVALDRLPLTMKEAGVIPGVSRPEIELYGTYDWQNVMDAKFALAQAMKKER